MDILLNKTLQKALERNKVNSAYRSRVIVVEVVVEPVVVPVPPATIPVEVTNIQVAIGVADTYSASSLPPPLDQS